MFNINKKRLIIIAAIVAGILVVSGVALGVAVWQSGKNLQDTEKTAKKPISQYKPEQRQKLVEDINQKYGSGDFTGAIELIEGQQNVEDANTQLLLAGAYANAGDLKKALEVYKKLDAAGKLPKIALENMAATAERAGDNRLAVDIYKRAKQHAVSSAEQNTDQIAVYDYKIAELEKKL